MSVIDGLVVTSERTGTTGRIIASGELDIASAPNYTTTPNAPSTTILRSSYSISHVSFIDSTGLHALLQAAARQPNRLRIVPSAVCLRLFDLVGVRDRLRASTYPANAAIARHIPQAVDPGLRHVLRRGDRDHRDKALQARLLITIVTCMALGVVFGLLLRLHTDAQR